VIVMQTPDTSADKGLRVRLGSHSSGTAHEIYS
jgi:hypothetical protein